MSRSCLAEEEIIPPYVDELLRRQTAYEVGLIVGKLAVGSRDLLYALVKTPDADGEGATAVKVAAPTSAAKKKGGKASNSGPEVVLPIDGEWIEEHSRQVARMLPGGVGVIGLYIFSSEGSFKASLPAIQRAAMRLPVAASGEVLVIHIDSTSRNKFAAKRFDGKPGSAARSAELKFGRVLSQVHCAEAFYSVDLAVQVGQGTLQQAARAALQAESARVAAAEVAYASALPQGAEQVCKVFGSVGVIGDGPPAALSVFRPPACVTLGLPEAEGAAGTVRLRGCVAARAYAYAREPWSRVVENIKEDIIASLTARLDLLVEDAERADEDAAEDPVMGGGSGAQQARPALLAPVAAGQTALLQMPRRIAVPWIHGLEVCDYLQTGESAADAVGRMRELIGGGLSETAVPRDLEGPADGAGMQPDGGPGQAVGAVSAKRGVDAAAGEGGKAGAAAGGGPANFLAAAGVAALAALLGLLVVFDDQLLDLI